MNTPARRAFSPVVIVIIAFGVISMLGDAVYEAARSVNSQYLSLLGISAAQVGLIFGIGEFLGYVLRLLAGVLADKSSRHWLFIFIGYGMLLVVPAIGLGGGWPVLVALILMERIGKALRSPAKDTVLSTVAENQVGIGFAFGLQEALDQLGAFAGPLVFSLVFFLSGRNQVPQHQLGYRLLLIPFLLLMLTLTLVYRKITRDNLAPSLRVRGFSSERLQPVFWVYTAFTFLTTLGFVNFSTTGYHLKAQGLLSDANIALLYAAAMAVDAVTALLIGRWYDTLKAKSGRRTGGLLVLVATPLVSLLLPFLTLAGSAAPVVAGMLLFGVVMGIHETVMRSAIADITPLSKRGTGYGVFNAAYGLALLGGAALMGLLYDLQRVDVLIALACAAELGALALYWKMNTMVRSGSGEQTG